MARTLTTDLRTLDKALRAAGIVFSIAEAHVNTQVMAAGEEPEVVEVTVTVNVYYVKPDGAVNGY